MSEARPAYFEPMLAPDAGAGPACEVCGKPGTARVCGCDGADLICHLADCEAVCVKCAIRARSAQAAASADKPDSREVVQPCILKVQEGCAARKADAASAKKAYQLLGIDRHSKASFVADVLFGHFENARLAGEAKLGEKDLDDFRHTSRCWTCWPPQPRLSAQWCIHPRELWKLREPDPKALDLAAIAGQIRALERLQGAVLDAAPETARPLLERRLAQLTEIARAVERKPGK